MNDDGGDLAVSFLEAAADVLDAERVRASATKRRDAAAARATEIARSMTRDWALTDEDAVRVAWRKALGEVQA